MQKNYYAIIPANVRYDKELTPNAKLLYGEITALSNEKGYCWASNSYFSELYGVSKTSISKWITQLIEKGYINSTMHYKEGTKEILNRYLTLVNDPIEEKLNTPIEDKLKDNNTLLNITSNKKDSCPKFKFETHHLKLAELLKKKMLANNSNAKIPSKLDDWANTFRLMMERDKRKGKEIQDAIIWSQQDHFWHKNILSADSLRKQYDRLYLEMNSKKPKQQEQTGRFIPDFDEIDLTAGED